MRFTSPRKRAPSGMTMLEVALALAILAIGGLITIGAMMNTGLYNEKSRQSAEAYEACQEIMEVLMTMDKPTLIIQRDWAAIPGNQLTFSVPGLNASSPPTGTYTITDVSNTLDPSAPSEQVFEYQVLFSWKHINIRLTGRKAY